MRLFLSFALVAIMAAVAPAADDPPESEAPGTLFLDGGNIEKLSLESKRGKDRFFTKPGESVSLEPGKYRVSEIEVEGSYTYSSYSSIESEWFTIEPGGQHHLRAGSPLTSHVDVERRGRVLELNYTLQDAAGRKYRATERSNPPSFTVMKDGVQIGGGTFEYG